MPHTVRTAMIMGLPFSRAPASAKTSAGPGRRRTRAPGAIDAAVEAVWGSCAGRTGCSAPIAPDSDISRIRRGELAVRDADPAVAEVLDFAEIARRVTERNVRRSRRPRTAPLDPSGIVKGWAASRAAAPLTALGLDYYLNAGGDVLLRSVGSEFRGGSASNTPTIRSGLLAVVELPNGARRDLRTGAPRRAHLESSDRRTGQRPRPGHRHRSVAGLGGRPGNGRGRRWAGAAGPRVVAAGT